MTGVYRIGDDVFVVTVDRDVEGAAYEGRVARLHERRRSVVLLPDGTPLHSRAPSAWQAAARAVHQLETSLGGVALELRGFDTSRFVDDGSWRLRGDCEV